MAEIYRCPHCQGIIGEVEWDEEDVVTLAEEPLGMAAEAACDPDDADTCIIVEDSILEE